MITKKCTQCEQDFRCTHSRQKYCSKDCVGSAYRLRLIGMANPNFRNAGARICLNCAKPFKNYNKRRKYCSPTCYVALNLDRIRAQAKGAGIIGGSTNKWTKPSFRLIVKKPRKQIARRIPPKICPVCHKQYYAYIKTRIYCSYPCALKGGSGIRAGQAARIATMKYGAKKDANHNLICDVLRSHGIAVYDTSSLGGGAPDCIVWAAKAWRLVEIKNPATAYGRRGLNKIQKRWISQWQGGPIFILRTEAEAHQFAEGKFDNIESVDSGYTEDALRVMERD